MIGSKTKRATFKNWYRREFGSDKKTKALVCPMGKTTASDKRPEVIASHVTAEIMEQISLELNSENGITRSNESPVIVRGMTS